MNLIPFLPIFAAAVLPLGSAASDWNPVTQSDDYDMFIEVESIQRHDSTAKAWVKLIYKAPLEVVVGPNKYLAQSAISLTSFRCAERAYLDLQTTTYQDKDSKVEIQDRRRTDFRADYHNVRPDTVGETMYNFVCFSGGGKEYAVQAKPMTEAPSTTSRTAGSFSLVHWLFAFFGLANVGTIIHIAVSTDTRRWRKAAWVGSALFIPFVPYFFWLFTRKAKVAQ